MSNKIRIGTCGFRGNKTEYSELLSTVEIQHTFYQPPQIKTLEKWCAELPADFQFTIKAWQIITHEAKSLTYKRLKRKLTEAEREDCGYFKPTEIVREAWQTTLACAEALGAKVILFQCPASFKPYAYNIENLKKFLLSIKRGKIEFAWEPRGADWKDETIKEICKEFDLRHAVDPFERKSVTPGKPYYRLHGRTGWRYTYEPDELEELAAMLPKNKTSYVFFNNISMIEDAVKFRNSLGNYSI